MTGLLQSWGGWGLEQAAALAAAEAEMRKQEMQTQLNQLTTRARKQTDGLHMSLQRREEELVCSSCSPVGLSPNAHVQRPHPS
jgi:hypothetical protein